MAVFLVLSNPWLEANSLDTMLMALSFVSVEVNLIVEDAEPEDETTRCAALARQAG